MLWHLPNDSSVGIMQSAPVHCNVQHATGDVQKDQGSTQRTTDASTGAALDTGDVRTCNGHVATADHSVHHATAQHAQCDSERRTRLATLVLLVGHSVLTGYSRTKRR